MTEQETRNPFKEDEQVAANEDGKAQSIEELKKQQVSMTDENATKLNWSDEMKTEFPSVKSP